MTILTFTLKLLEPVLVTALGGDPNSDESEGYLPGSTMRGALAARYLSLTKQVDDVFTRLFLNGQVRFLNAYPTGRNWPRVLPTPRSWVMAKDGDPLRIYDRAHGEEPDLPKSLKQLFVEVDTRQHVIGAEVNYEVAVHTARNRQKGRAVEGDPESAVYRYRALRAGQSFAGIIVVGSGSEKAGDAQTLTDLLQSSDMLLGGSHSAGYGLVAVENIQEAKDSWREGLGQPAALLSGESFTVILLSDAIVRDSQSGQEGAGLPEALARLLKCKLEVAQTFIDLRLVGGFNLKWGLPLPQSWAVLKGSQWTLKPDREISESEIRQIELTGVGERRAEGFGQVLFNPVWPTGELRLEDAEQSVAQDEPRFPRLSGEAAILASRMKERLARHELDRLVVVAAQKKAAAISGRVISKSQLARLRLRARGATTRGSFKDLLRYLEDTEKRKSANDQFRKFSIGGQNFRDWLKGLAGNPQNLWEEVFEANQHWQAPTLGAEPFRHDTPELTRDYTIRLIDAVCEQLAKKGR